MSPSVELPELDPFVEDFQQFPFGTLVELPVQVHRHRSASLEVK
jgi:hypothetical protein